MLLEEIDGLAKLIDESVGDADEADSGTECHPEQDAVAAPLRWASVSESVGRRSLHADAGESFPGLSRLLGGPSVLIPSTAASLAVHFLSPYRVICNGEPVSGWPNCRGKRIFNYLITHRHRPVPKEVLMDRFWPDVEPDNARNNLNMAIYGLRKLLGGHDGNRSLVVFKDGCYSIRQDVEIWVDAEAFMQDASAGTEFDRRGDVAAAIEAYRRAEAIYQNDYLADEREDDWLLEVRQKFRNVFLAVTDRLSRYYFDDGRFEACLWTSARMLAVDRCDERVHCRMIRAFARLGQHHLAVRQYFACRDALAQELGTTPGVEIVRLFDRVRRRLDV